MDLNLAEKRLGSVMLYECLGTGIVVACWNTVDATNIAPIAFLYFVSVVLTVKITGAMLNPALTWAVWVQQKQYWKQLRTMVMIICSQLIGALLGLQASLMLHVVAFAGNTAWPSFDTRVPPITGVCTGQAGCTTDYVWFRIMWAEAFGTMVFAMFYLNFMSGKLGGGDIVFSGLALSVVYYAMMWLMQQTTSGILNPAIAVAQQLSNQWNYFFNGLETSPVDWKIWFAWVVGPFWGAGFAAYVQQYQ